jgi:hypothetical protein
MQLDLSQRVRAHVSGGMEQQVPHETALIGVTIDAGCRSAGARPSEMSTVRTGSFSATE